LLEVKDGSYTFNTDMLEFIRTIRNKYRVYLLINMDEGYTKETLEEIKELLHKLVK
jgi:FMN phosphatase YigB (HAD superfamily)